MDLIRQLQGELDGLAARGLRRFRRTANTACGARVNVGGRELLAFCSNDYLGLAGDPRLAQAMAEGASRYGAGSGASHLISGHSYAHEALEQALAAFLSPHVPQARSLGFSTGYMANLALIAALSASADETEIFSEALNHASLIDGMRLARAPLRVYPHGDAAALAGMLAASTARTKLVVTDSVFSMDGDLAPLPRLLALCEQYGAWLVVDDAHGFGVLGAGGRGALEHFGLRSEHLVYMGTLGKAAGVAGAFVCAHETVIEWMIQRARPYIYTTAQPPALAHALLASLRIIDSPEGAQRRARLGELAGVLSETLALRAWRLPPSPTAIQPIIIGDNDAAMRAAARLYESGFWVPAIRPPTVPAGTARLRLTLSAAHEPDDVAALARAVNGIESGS